MSLDAGHRRRQAYEDDSRSQEELQESLETLELLTELFRERLERSFVASEQTESKAQGESGVEDGVSAEAESEDVVETDAAEDSEIHE